MENAARALEMAAGVLLGVILMAAVAYFFSNIGVMPETQDQIMTQEQLTAFNKEFEVFQKSGMYGVDVISCLNKAKSNNEKYAEGRRFLSGGAYGDDFKIQVFVNIKKPLEESIEVYAYDSLNTKKLIQVFDYPTGTTSDKKETLKSVGIIEEDGQYQYTMYKTTDDLMAAAQTTHVLTGDASKYMVANGGTSITLSNGTSKNYYALKTDYSKADGPVEYLLKYSNTMQITKMNLGKKDNKDVWNTVVWTTALYNFKTKRFQCDYLEYNGDNGRVSKIYFSEL